MVMEDMNYMTYKNTLKPLNKQLASLRELQSATGEELDALLPSRKGMISVLDRAFKGEL